MVEVFKTDVRNPQQARALLDHIHKIFSDYNANFDLEDCDNILRVESEKPIHSSSLIDLLHRYGFKGMILPDETGILSPVNI